MKIQKCGQVLQGEGNKPLRLCVDLMWETGQNCSRGRCCVPRSPSVCIACGPGRTLDQLIPEKICAVLTVALLPCEALPCLYRSCLLRSGHSMDDVLERRASPSHAVGFGCLFKDSGCQPSLAVTLQYLLQ